MKKIIFVGIAGVLVVGLAILGIKLFLDDSHQYPKAIIEYQRIFPIDTLEALSACSSNIVKAKLSKIDDFDGTICMYTYKVTDDYTDNTPDKIIVYDAYYEGYEKGHSYYLFLHGTENALYPHNTVYTTVLKKLVLDTKTEKVVLSQKTGYTIEVKSLPVIIEKQVLAGNVGAKIGTRLVVTESKSLSEVFDISDYVARIKIAYERNVNRYISSYETSFIEALKGSGDYIPRAMALQPGIDTSKEYFIFMKKIPGDTGEYVVFDRNYTVIEATPENEALLTK